MRRIFYSAEDYQNDYQNVNTNGVTSISCKKLDLYRAIITVGSTSWINNEQIKRFGFVKAISRSVLPKLLYVYNFIDSTQDGLFLSPAFHSEILDSKRVISYNLGMAITKIYSEKIFFIKNLIHVEFLKKNNAILFINSSKKEPDLIGYKSDGWHVFEAKGNSTNKLASKVRDAKIQAQQIQSINGQIPITSNACATYFSESQILTMLSDPSPKNEKILKVKMFKFIETYYLQILCILDENNNHINIKIGTHEFITTKIKVNKLDIRIGVEKTIFENLKRGNYENVIALNQEFENSIKTEQNINYSLGLDGIICIYEKNFA